MVDPRFGSVGVPAEYMREYSLEREMKIENRYKDDRKIKSQKKIIHGNLEHSRWNNNNREEATTMTGRKQQQRQGGSSNAKAKKLTENQTNREWLGFPYTFYLGCTSNRDK